MQRPLISLRHRLWLGLLLVGVLLLFTYHPTRLRNAALNTRTVVDARFGAARYLGEIADTTLDEISGVAADSTGQLWVLNDGGDAPRVYALDSLGQGTQHHDLPGIANRDWEELAITQGTLWVAEVGDNRQQHPRYALHTLTLPIASNPKPSTRYFVYTDGPHDCEAFFVADDTVFLITKREARARIYVLPVRAQHATDTARYYKQLPLQWPTAASLHPQGQLLVIATYAEAYCFEKGSHRHWQQALAQPPTRIVTPKLYQCEAVGWATDGHGIYLTSERQPGRSSVPLYFIPFAEKREP